MTLFSFSLCGAEDIWYDELFTMSFATQPVGRLLELAAQDVHPPLYYLIVKAFLECVRLAAPSVSAVAAAKAVSVLPYAGLLIYSAVLVRKRDGWLCAGLFAFCLLAMPQLSNYTTEVRMYGWALFFLTTAFLHVREILLTGKKLHWAVFWVYGVCAAYCHYFAAVSAALLYLALAGLLLRRRRKTCGTLETASVFRTLAAWLVCAALSVLAYLPWLPSAIRQVSGRSPQFFRAPYLDTNDLMYETIDLTFIGGFDVKDWDPAVTAADRSQGVLTRVKDGDIVLLHDFKGNDATAEALKTIIPELKKQGYTFVTVSQLFKQKGVTPTPYAKITYHNVYDK